MCVCGGGVVHTGRGGHRVWAQGPTQLLRMCMAALFTKEKETGNKPCLSRGEWRNECGTCHTWYRSLRSVSTSREGLGAPQRRDGELGVRSFSLGQLLRRSRQPRGTSTCGEGHDAGVWECAAAGQGLPQEGNLDRGLQDAGKITHGIEQGTLQPDMYLPPGVASCHRYPPHFPATSPILSMGL